MKLPRLDRQPYRIDSLAWYAVSPDEKEQFILKDRFGEPYSLYAYDVTTDMIGVPRNCAPYSAWYDQNADEMSVAVHMTSGGKVYNWSNGFVPRNSEQQRLVDESYDLIQDTTDSDSRGFIIQAPTGFGKTYVGSALIQRLGVRTCVITTKEDIVDSWVDALADVLCIPKEKVGIWRGDKIPDESHEAVVALVQSVAKGPERYDQSIYNSFGCVMVDEVHRMGADFFSQAMCYFPARIRIGLSATPYRKDGREIVFRGHIGPVRVETEQATMKFKVIAVDTEWEVPEVWQFDPKKGKNVFGPLKIPWDRSILAVKHLAKDRHRNDIINAFVQGCLRKGRNVVIFSDTVDHLKIINERLIEGGMDEDDWGWYVGLQADVYKRDVKDRPLDENGSYTGYRQRIREAAKYKPVCGATYKMASEATNVPWWDTAVLTTPKADVVQIVGRILREYPDKPTPIVFDLCDYEHEVTATFAKKRRQWYESQDAEIVYR